MLLCIYDALQLPGTLCPSTTMSYPKKNLSQGVIFLLGMYPMQEQQQLRWQNKVNVLGFILALWHSAMTVFLFRSEQINSSYLSANKNNIVQSTIILERLMALAVPLVFIASRFCYVRTMERFWEKVHVLDGFLRSVQEEKEATKAEQRILRANLLAGVFVVVCACFNVTSFYFYYLLLSGTEWPRLSKIYYFNYATIVYSSGAMYIFARIYGLSVRLECLAGYVDSIRKDMDSMMGKRDDETMQERRRRLLDNFIEGTLN